jgi:hypothetical protein
MAEMETGDWERLIQRIRDGKCTPFLGAGVNHGYLPTGAKLASDWACKHGYPLPDTTDLAKVAQFIAVESEDAMWPKDQILRKFREAYKEQDFSAQDNPLGILAELPMPIYITTNYDDYLRQALRFKRKKPQLELCRWNKYVAENSESILTRNPNFEATVDTPVVFHLHGHEDMAESLVLTEDDYLDFLVNISRQQLLPTRIQRALSGTSLLFVGYKLADWDFRVLLHGLVNSTEKALRRLSISVQLPPEVSEDNRVKAMSYLEKYFGAMQVRIFWGKASEFAQKLRDAWKAAGVSMEV